MDKMKLLIAEDNATLQRSLTMMMDLWDIDFDMASDGRSAVELAERNDGNYDLCLMDIDMPVMNGFEAARIIRGKMRYFPVMALTGNLSAREEYLKAGMDDYLEKPYLPNELYDKIHELTVKALAVHRVQNHFVLKKEMPVNPEELKELRELDKKGLTKISLVDTGFKFVVHKNLQNKISHDLAEGKLLSEFLDRSSDEPGIIHLYAANLRASKRYILPELFEQLEKQENEEMEGYTTKAEFLEKPEGSTLNKK